MTAKVIPFPSPQKYKLIQSTNDAKLLYVKGAVPLNVYNKLAEKGYKFVWL